MNKIKILWKSKAILQAQFSSVTTTQILQVAPYP